MKMKKICLFSLFRQKKSVNEDLSLLIQISSPKTTECTFYLWYSNFYFYCLNVHSLFKVWNLSGLTETNLFWPECVLFFFWAGLFLPLWFTIFSAWIGVFMFLKKQTGTHLALHVAVTNVSPPFSTIWHVSLTPAGMDMWQLCKGCSLGHNVQT